MKPTQSALSIMSIKLLQLFPLRLKARSKTMFVVMRAKTKGCLSLAEKLDMKREFQFMGLSINRINLNSTPANGEIAPRRRKGKTLNPLRTFTAFIPNSLAHSESFPIKKSIPSESSS